MTAKSMFSFRSFLVLVVFAIVLSGCGSANNNGKADAGEDAGKAKNEASGNETGGHSSGEAKKPAVELLNVSYDPTRELYEAYNKLFADYWKKEQNQDVTIKQSHGGSGKQSRAVIDGLKADVVTLALGYDIDAIADQGITNPDWQKKFESNSSPYTSTIVLLVRKGNPKGIKDWNDLIKDDVEVITPNPKTSGGARWNYLAAWGYALKQNGGDEDKAKAFVAELFKHVPVLDSGARGSTTTFVERGLGDVLLAWENEAYLSVNELGKDKFEIIYPSISILAEPPVAVVDKVADNKGTRDVAEAYLNYLYTEEAQKLVAENYYRPQLASVAEQFKDRFPQLDLLTIDGDFGGWKEAQSKHFADGGVFDQIYTPGS
ncbi:sulfate ABC transporter substrate-binding protein [Paenibacillus spongiae]|uniref:Sulfate ABC transporter substrate-binding protein n=2 Tax=Paenibacillus spongiae TaxID=2909671 RepID=A0ABY5SHU1_9BACL|nr:sulfate ABC transporter substrate-binding protein [Paenibacillus spongiae]UVI33587.1 sulfate ABC transporter substrate-binding protein [Paenibacillus spongiae]